MTTHQPPAWMCPLCPPHLKALHHPERGCDRCGCQERHPEGERFVSADAQPSYVSIHERPYDPR